MGRQSSVPFWVHQATEYFVAFALISQAAHGGATVVLICGVVVGIHAAVADGPLGCFRWVPSALHRGLDVVVVALLAVAPFVGLGPIDALSVVLVEGSAVLLLYLSMNTRVTRSRTAGTGDREEPPLVDERLTTGARHLGAVAGALRARSPRAVGRLLGRAMARSRDSPPSDSA